jgi:sporulation protein YlmC with PRC-barrel domain
MKRRDSQGKPIMTKAMIFAGAAMISLAVLSGGVSAQGLPQTVEKVNVQKLAAGYRASKVIGSNVVNNANETIGKVDDLLVSLDGKQPYAVLSIDAGFLGTGSHLVVVPFDTLQFAGKKVTLPGGTKAGLEKLPVFKYAAE